MNHKLSAFEQQARFFSGLIINKHGSFLLVIKGMMTPVDKHIGPSYINLSISRFLSLCKMTVLKEIILCVSVATSQCARLKT